MGIGLSQLGSMIADQFLQGENSDEQRTLKADIGGKSHEYGKLGDFAKKIDQSAQRNYLEQGYLDNSFNNPSAKMTEIIMQQPEVTVLVRKKMFTSLANNYATEYMNEEERLTYLAMDKLFANKAKQISAYERLCKIQKASQKMGEVNEQLLPIIIGFEDAALSTVNAFSSGVSSLFGSFGDVIRKVKAVYNYSNTNFYTTWIEDVITPSYLRYGSGTGAIEFTSAYSIGTNVGLSGEQTFSLTFDDPYNLMTVTLADIENAISDVVNINNSFGPKMNADGEELFGSDYSIGLGKEIAGDLVQTNIDRLNQVRAARGASPISFKIDPGSIYGRKVIAIVDRLGQEIPFNAKNVGIPWSSGVDVDAPYLRGGASLGEDGLATQADKSFKDKKYSNVKINVSSELELFSDVIKSIFTKINLDANTNRTYDFVNGDDLVNYIRKKLTFYFAGKNIIQPMDVVNIYISSKTNTDGKIMSGIKDAFTGFGLVNNFSNQMQQGITMVNNLFSPSTSLDFQMEKSLILGENNIPNYLWFMLRDQFTSEKEGCHVFAGVFNKVTTNFTGAEGGYNVAASGFDNTYYLKMSQVNFNPGAANTTGNFFDPLTIYQTKFDSVYGESDITWLPLLKENQEIMNDVQHPLRNSSGPKSGAIIKDGNIPSEVEYTQVGYSPSGEKVIYAPDGLVYKWKEGIQTLELRGSASDIASSPSFSQQSAVSEALANQDVMNCISLLVTGFPYNYYTYYKAAVALGNLKVNSTKTALSPSRLTELLESVSKNNLTWGNFIPYKSLSVTSSQFSEMMSVKNQELIKNQTSLNKLYKEADILKTSLITQSLNLESGNYNINAISEKYKDSLESLYSRISSAQQNFITSISDPNYSHFSIIGNDIAFDSDYFINNGGDDPSLQNKRQIRRKSQFLTRRLSWQVRQNSDANYLIVDDSYDKNNDLLAFEGNINGNNINLFGTELSDVLAKVKQAAGFINMEFYADTQGHLRVRAPQYNKMPSSVFLTLLKNKKSKRNVQIFPKFLNNLLLDQLKNLYNKVSAVEDEIRLLCCLLGLGNTLQYGGDDPVITYIRGTETSNSIKYNKKDFKFLSSPTTGQILDYNSINSIESNFNNLDKGLLSQSFLAVKQLKDQAQSQINLKNTFDIASRINRFKSDLNSIIKKQNDIEDQLTNFENGKKIIEDLVVRIFDKTGEIIKPEKYVNSLFSETQLLLNQISLPKVYTVPNFEINNQISKKINERQKLVKQLYYFAKSTYEFNALDNSDEAIKFFTNPNSQDAPEIFDFLIEDESYDDLGPGSGSRYIIKNSQIISYTFNENNPEFTGVTVTGRIAKNYPADAAKTDNTPLPSSGNPLTSSSALDYDLWKMYGYKWIGDKSYPLLTDPRSQTTPVAVGLLMEQRKKIFTATVVITGNEYMQPGEVVFLEQIGMLFYVNKVNHTFNYSNDGGAFTTTLDLVYGHMPGEYIPNITDLVGKLLYVNRDTSNTTIKKGIPTVAGKSAGAMAMINRDVAKNFDKNNPLLFNNIKAINKIASELRKALATNSQPNIKTVLNIITYKSNVYSNISAPLAAELRNILLGTSSIYKIEDASFKPFTEEQIPQIQEVNLSDEKEKRGPSTFAYGIAGNLISKKTFSDIVKASQTNSGKAQLRNKYVCNYIVDCFIKTYPK